jgi:hypothetical protein
VPTARRRNLLALGFAVFLFVGISLLLARGLTATAKERGDVLALARAEARGDVRAVLARLPACAREPGCAEATARRVRALRRPGTVELLQYRPSAELVLTPRSGTGRLAWRAGTGRPVVQCVRVRREGPLTGAGVELLAVSAPIALDGACPR